MENGILEDFININFSHHIDKNINRKIDHRSGHIIYQRSESDSLFEASSLLQIPIINKDSVLLGQEIHINIVQLGSLGHTHKVDIKYRR